MITATHISPELFWQSDQKDKKIILNLFMNTMQIIFLIFQKIHMYMKLHDNMHFNIDISNNTEKRQILMRIKNILYYVYNI